MRQAFRSDILSLPSHPINEIARIAWAQGGVTPLFFGEGDLVTPAFIREAAKRALDDGKTFYAPTTGIPELREAIAAYSSRVHGRAIDVRRITVPGSAMLSIVLALECTVRTGDNVVVVSPVWPSTTLAALALGAQVRYAPLARDKDGGWCFDLGRVTDACDARTRAIFICTPCNPTGWVMTREEQRELLEFSRARSIALISDEVYSRLIYDAPCAPSFLEIAEADDPVIVINGFSKAFAMTGWRIGWMTAPEFLEAPLRALSTVNNPGATVFAQYGALAALTDPRGEAFIVAQRERCRRGKALIERIARRSNRIRPFRIDGSFYAYLEIDGITDSFALAERLVREAKVGVAPGVAFGPGNEAFIRLCFALDENTLEAAMERLIAAL